MANNTTTSALTQADREALAALPAGWFEWHECYFQRPQYRLERLEKVGLVESRVVGSYPDLKTEYRRVGSGE